MSVPDRTLLLPIQNAIWNLLKYESFVKFKVEIGKGIRTPPDKTVISYFFYLIFRRSGI